EHLGDTKAATLKARPSDVLAIAGIIFDGGLGTAALAAMGAHFEELGVANHASLPLVITTSMIHQQRWTADPVETGERPAVVMPLPIHFGPLLGALTASAQDGNAAPMGTTNALTFAPPSLRQARAQGAVVLVAEDNEINRLVIQRLLHRLGFAAEMANNGSAAPALLRRRPFGLVLADIHMPVMDGLKLAKEIRRMDLRTAAGQPVPIVALTADVLVSTEAVTRQAGMDAYLRKPISVEGLRDVLAEFMPQALPLRISKPRVDDAAEPPSGPELDADGEVEDDLFAGIAPETLEAGQFAATFDFMEADAKGFFDRYMAALGDGLTQLAWPAVSADLAQVRAIAPCRFHKLEGQSS
ncbi:MAG: response regulator, partial [Thalassobaculaceae bacterium]